MTAFAFLTLWLCLGVFAAATSACAIRHARQPMHLRWELYPVPHEARQRVRHGGSRFEETDWWTRPQPRNLAGELAFMLPEMLYLDGLRRHNRQLWYRSFPFHVGLYLMAVAASVLLLVAALAAAGVSPGPAARSAVSSFCGAVSACGVILAACGAVALLHARLTDPALAPFSAPADYFNLALFTGVPPLLLAGVALEGSSPLAIATRLVSFDTAPPLNPVLSVGLVLAGLVIAYIPFTHMSHFVAKWFTYHHVRWDDKEAGERVRAKMTEYLTYRPTWAAPHVQGDGTKTWSDIAASNPAGKGKK